MPNTILKIIRIRTLSNTICCTKDIILLKTFIFSNGLFLKKILYLKKGTWKSALILQWSKKKNKQTEKGLGLHIVQYILYSYKQYNTVLFRRKNNMKNTWKLVGNPNKPHVLCIIAQTWRWLVLLGKLLLIVNVFLNK